MTLRNYLAIIYFYLFPNTFGRGYETYKHYLINKIINGRKAKINNYFDERIVEIPWIMNELKNKSGKLLDAGSTLNFKYLLQKLIKNFEVNIVTLYPEKKNYEYLGINYIYSDFLNLKYKKNTFDIITCISTLEHVGFDNSFYKYNKNIKSKEIQRTNKQMKVLFKLYDFLKPGGNLLITLPFGKRGKYRNLRQFDKDKLKKLLVKLKARKIEKKFFLYKNKIWKKVSEQYCKNILPITNKKNLFLSSNSVVLIKITK
tara:strand:- start:125 stop:898 length:774 start_codon:yes stop_codon:yes gene_type:complete